MDGPVTEALQLGAAQEALELWWVHTEHINRVFENGGKGRGCQNATYHPKLMNWSIAFLARTSSGTYNEVAKIFMLPHISTLIAVDCGDDLLCNSRRWDHAQPEQQRHVSMLQIFCEHWNEVVDICNGRRGPHSPANATQRQTSLLETLACFSRWKKLHDKRVKEKHATEYIFLQMKLSSASNCCCWDTLQSCTSTV